MLGGQPWRAGVVAPPSVTVLLTSVAVAMDLLLVVLCFTLHCGIHHHVVCW